MASQSPIKIAFLRASNAATGGLEKFTTRLIEAFKERGFSCTLITSGNVSKTSFEVVSLLSRKCFGSLATLLLFDYKVRRFLRDRKFEYVFGLDRNFVHQDLYRAGNGCHAAYLNHRKYFSSLLKRFLLQINPLHWLICKMEKRTFEETKLLFVNSKLVKDEIVHYYPNVVPEKIHVIHNGVSWHAFEKPFEESFQKKQEIRRELQLSQEAYQFLFVGNEYRRKGLELLLEALVTIKEPWELSVLGKERNMGYFKDKVKELHIDDKVHFVGVVSPLRWYQAADALVVPSYYDPFASVTVEALAMGLYVVSSPQNGGKEIITQPTMGDVFADFTSDSVSASLQKAVKNPKTYEAALERRRAVAYLDFSFVLPSYIDKMPVRGLD